MKNKVNQFNILFVAVCLSLMMFGSGLNDFSFFHQHACLQTECTDLSAHAEHSHSFGFDDFVVLDGFHKNSNHLKGTTLISLTSVSIDNPFTASVWQPPKFS